jgi:hypothetical protein
MTFLERQFSAAQFRELYLRRHKTQIPVEIMIIHGAAREFVSYELLLLRFESYESICKNEVRKDDTVLKRTFCDIPTSHKWQM